MIWLILCFAFLVANPTAQPIDATDEHSVEVKVETSGMTPPPSVSFDCATSLRGKPFSQKATRNCLNKLLATGFFENGKLQIDKSTNHVMITFHLTSPVLLTHINVSLSDPDKSNLLFSLDNTVGVLREGEVYNEESEFATSRQIRKFFFLQRRRTGLQTRINLDYRAKTATVSYSIVEGPPGPGPGDLEPYSLGENCKELVSIVDFRGADDYVPVILVERLMKTHFGSCYDPKSVHADAEMLRATGMFSDVELAVEGLPERRKVSVKILGKPLTVSSISVKCYGRTGACPASDALLPLTPGSIYTRSADWLTKERLENVSRTYQQNTWIFEDVTQTNQGIAVAYGVIYENTELVINGRSLPNPSADSTGPANNTLSDDSGKIETRN